MKDIRTYSIGSGEITLTAQDAEELRRTLQFEYIESCINSIIEQEPQFFCFTSEHNRPLFVRKVAEMHDDLVDMYGCYAECLDETVFHIARHVGVTNADNAIDDIDGEFREFWKE